MTALLRPRPLLAVLCVVVVSAALDATSGVARAGSPAYAPCELSLRDQEPPGGTSAYNLKVSRRGTSCATATKVMRAFHACRAQSSYRCTRRVRGTWRCTGRSDGVNDRMFAASFHCAAGAGRVRSSYFQDTPACFGAAARDPKLPCVNRSQTVTPRFGQPDREKSWECSPGIVPDVCVFGVDEKRATRHIAIVGDSHVGHWRAALHHVTQIEGWRGYSLSAGGCFLSEVAGLFTEGCGEWSRGAASVLAAHPEVSTLFVTQNADSPVALQPGETLIDVKARGFMTAWRALPKTIKHIIVLRDLTISTEATFRCLGAAITARARLATACPLARSVVLRADPAVEAVRRLKSPRYQVIDLSRYLCGPRQCYPVVGGTPVNGDVWGHLNMTFMRTLAPYLMRELRRLEAAW